MGKVRTVLASDKFHSIVAQVVRAAAGKVVTYSVKRYVVRPAYLTKVADLIGRKKIKVVIIQGKSDFHGGYVSRNGGYLLIEPWGKKKDVVSYRSTMVHEAVHASFDMLGEKHPFTMNAHDDEAAAYIGQAMYLIRQGVLASEFTSFKEPVRAAHGVARAILTSKQPAATGPLFDNLMAVIAKWYKNRIRKKDGVT